jgi:hypothetical protein
LFCDISQVRSSKFYKLGVSLGMETTIVKIRCSLAEILYKFQFFEHCKGPRPFFYPLRFSNSNLLLTVFCFLPWFIFINSILYIYIYIYIDSSADIPYYCKSMYSKLYFLCINVLTHTTSSVINILCNSVNTIHLNWTHKHAQTLHFIYLDSWTNILCSCTQLVHSCTLPCNLTLPTHTCGAHTLCLDQLYCFAFILYSSPCTVYTCTVDPVNLC